MSCDRLGTCRHARQPESATRNQRLLEFSTWAALVVSSMVVRRSDLEAQQDTVLAACYGLAISMSSTEGRCRWQKKDCALQTKHVLSSPQPPRKPLIIVVLAHAAL